MTPRLSAIVVCSGVERQARSFLEHLAALGAAHDLELVLVSRAEHDYGPFVAGRFGAVRRVGFGRDEALNQGRARAVALASAPVVVLLEDHVRFEAPFVEVLLELFADGRSAAVGWVVEPGRPDPPVSLAGWLVEYAAWGPAAPAGPSASLPGHNCAYRREVLMRHAAELPSLMRAENILHARLAAQGERLLLTRRIRMRHYQFLSLRRFVAADFWYGWNYADTRQRAAGWGVARRLVQAAGWTAIPLVRWARLAPVLRRERVPAAGLLRCAPAVTLAFAAASAGEALGHLVGAPAGVLRRLTSLEVDFDRGVHGVEAGAAEPRRVAPARSGV